MFDVPYNTIDGINIEELGEYISKHIATLLFYEHARTFSILLSQTPLHTMNTFSNSRSTSPVSMCSDTPSLGFPEPVSSLYEETLSSLVVPPSFVAKSAPKKNYHTQKLRKRITQLEAEIKAHKETINNLVDRFTVDTGVFKSYTSIMGHHLGTRCNMLMAHHINARLHGFTSESLTGTDSYETDWMELFIEMGVVFLSLGSDIAKDDAESAERLKKALPKDYVGVLSDVVRKRIQNAGRGVLPPYPISLSPPITPPRKSSSSSSKRAKRTE